MYISLHLTCSSSIPMDFLNFFSPLQFQRQLKVPGAFKKSTNSDDHRSLAPLPKLQLEVVTASIRGGRDTKGGLQRLC